VRHWRWVAGLCVAAGWLLGGCPTTGTPGATTDDPNVVAEDPNETTFADCYLVTDGDAREAEVLRLVNIERAAVGAPALEWSAALAAQAEEACCAMIHYGYFAHENPVTGSTPDDRFVASGFAGTTYGENIAAGQTTPQRVVEAWMDSPGHRANMLDANFTHLGVAVRLGGAYNIYWVQFFGG